MIKRIISAVLAILILSLCCACTAEKNGETNKETTTGKRTETEILPPVIPTEDVARGDLMADFISMEVEGKTTDEKFESALLDFSAELFKRTLDEDKNSSLISPLSVLIALGMVSNGAEGETRAQFEDVFGMPVGEINAYLYSYIEKLCSHEETKVKIADSIWFGKDGRLKVSDDFLQINKNFYDAQAYEEDFFDSATVKKINDWVSGHTDGMIDKVIDEIPPEAVMYLINALVFDALWTEQYYDSAISKDKFNNYDGEKSSVTYMTSEEKRYINTGDAEGFIKPYRDGFSFVALLPEGDIFDYIESLDGEKLGSLLKSAKYADVIAKLPCFEYDYSIEMNEALSDMGLDKAFIPTVADFSGIGESKDPLYIGTVLHKTHIELTAAGTKAAAVTVISVKATGSQPFPSKKIYISLDKPFVYMIIDNSTSLPVFMGAVTEIG